MSVTDTHAVEVFDPVLSEADAEAMVELCERFGTYTLYTSERSADHIAPDLAPRDEAAINIERTGGPIARDEPVGAMAARTHNLPEE
jgi:hypothetical protein